MSYGWFLLKILFSLKTSLGLRIQLTAKQVPVSISIKFGIPGNTSMIYDSSGSRYILKPIEKMTRFNNFSIQHPSEKSAIRVYHPTWVGEEQSELIENSSELKPGFFDQSKAFKFFVDNQPYDRALCSISDAAESLEFAYCLAKLL